MLLEFGRITYVTNWGEIQKKISDKTYKAIMVGYMDNHPRDMYKLYNPDINRIIMTKYVKLAEW